MRNRWQLWFWTELGRRMLDGDSEPELPRHAPPEMIRALASEPPVLTEVEILLGEQMQDRAARHVYRHVWKAIAREGFSRPLRLDPWERITLLLPFHRGSLAILPQSFSERVPIRERVLSLCGRTGAASLCGVDLLIVAAKWDDSVVKLAAKSGLRMCSLDRIGEAIC